MNWQRLLLPALIIFHFFLLTSSSFTVWPEMILYPFFMNKGFLLYKDIVNPYFPLLSIFLSYFFYVFGLSIVNLKLVTYLIILFLDLVVFLSAFDLSKNIKKSLLALVIFILLQISFGGNGLWFELALTPFLIYGLVTIFVNKESKLQLLIAGFFLASAVLIKQNALLFYLPVTVLLISKKKLKNLFYIFFPGALLFFLIFLYLQNLNILDNFFSWAIKLPVSFSSQPGFVLMPSKKQYFSMFLLLLPVIALFRTKINKVEKFYFMSSAGIALLFAFPRYENFHLQILIVFSAIFSALLKGKNLIIFFCISLVLFLLSYPRIWHKEDRFLDQETYELSRKITNYNSVYLMNSPDLAYFFANKYPSKPWAINFPWYFEQNGFEEKFIGGLKKSRIEYVVIGDRLGGGKYDLGNYLPENLLAYVYKEYSLVERFNNFSIWRINSL